MKAEVEIISVAQAKEYLERSAPNRFLSETTALRYADDMRNGRWQPNGQGIVLAPDGSLLDGQHRCRAIILAQRPVAMLVVRGVDPAAFATMDTGKARTLGDVLSINGVKNSVKVASIASAVYNYASGLSFSTHPTKATLYAFARKHPYLSDIASAVTSHRFNLIPPKVFGGVLALANESRNLDKEVADFIEGVGIGDRLWKGDARLTLRNWVSAKKMSATARHGLSSLEYLGPTIRAWNAFATGKELERISVPNVTITRDTLPIFGFDQTLYPDVPDLAEKNADVARSNLAVARKVRNDPKVNAGALP